MALPYSQFRNARKYGYRSGLEISVSKLLKEQNIKFSYESVKIEWEDLAYRTYTTDFILHNGIIIETKGMFTAADRRKHLAVKRQHPKLDIRFVFENSRRKLRKGAKSTYSEWCTKYGFLYYDRIIPEDWLKKRGKNSHPTLIKFRGAKIKRR